jgi:methylmalonyl-CoA mutase C-terminal domain/subunit
MTIAGTKAAASRAEAATGGRPIKVLVAKPGLDGHDVGGKVVVRALKDAGMEVIYTGLRKTPEEIARMARDEDVDVIGFSVLSGSHIPLCRRLRELWDEYNLGTRLWIVGGNVPEKDWEQLKDIGVDGVFATGSKLDDIVAFIREKVSKWPRN